MTSNMDRNLCSGGGNNHSNWLGGEIKLFQWYRKVDIIPHGFLEYEHCAIVEKDEDFELRITNDDGVCITSLSVNGNQLLVGKNNDQESFWMNKDKSKGRCLDDHMQTDSIKIRDGHIIDSECKTEMTQNQVEVVASCSSGSKIGVLSGEFKAVGMYNGRQIYENPNKDENEKWWSFRFDNETNRWIFSYANYQITPGEVAFEQTIESLPIHIGCCTG